jgi:hypothetical protein
LTNEALRFQIVVFEKEASTEIFGLPLFAQNKRRKGIHIKFGQVNKMEISVSEDNIKMHLIHVGWENMKWTNVA